MNKNLKGENSGDATRLKMYQERYIKVEVIFAYMIKQLNFDCIKKGEVEISGEVKEWLGKTWDNMYYIWFTLCILRPVINCRWALILTWGHFNQCYLYHSHSSTFNYNLIHYTTSLYRIQIISISLSNFAIKLKHLYHKT